MKDNFPKTILSLFDYSGNWSLPYREAGYNVIQVDIQLGSNIYDLDYKSLEVYGILAAPPCTDFAVSGARWFKGKDERGDTQKSIDLICKTLEIINYLSPVFWCLENPIGRLKRLVPELREYSKGYFNPCDYGDPYTKKTELFGVFNFPPKSPVEPLENSKMALKYGGKSLKTKNLRSLTPMGFSRAFYEYNK